MSDISIAHHDLMNRWKDQPHHKDGHFIEDGIIDYARWKGADRKILFFLKEAYGDYDDICSLIREEWQGPKYKMWWCAAYWLYALRKITGKSAPIFPKSDRDFHACKNYLLESAIVNIKKSGGNPTSDDEELSAITQKDGHLLREQIGMIAPDIILCGGTFDPFKELWGDELVEVGGTGFIHRAGSHIVINWWHPANQYPNELCFYALCSIFQAAHVYP